MVSCFVQNFFFGQHELEYYFFLSRKARIFFPEFNIRLYDKNSESDYFLFPPPKSEYFFSNIGNQNIFLEKNHYPPFKLNGPSLMEQWCHQTREEVNDPYWCVHQINASNNVFSFIVYKCAPKCHFPFNFQIKILILECQRPSFFIFFIWKGIVQGSLL